MGWQDRDYNRGFNAWGGGGWGYQQPQMRVRFGPVMTPVVKILLITNAVVFVLNLLTNGRLYFLAYNPYFAIRKFFIWQFVTYMFMHGGVWHIVFNMFPLWIL